MTTMIRELYEALKEAGASEEKAAATAEVLSKEFLSRTESHLATKEDLHLVREDTHALRGDMQGLRTDLEIAKAELAMVKWIVSGVGFGVLLLVIRSFWPGG